MRLKLDSASSIYIINVSCAIMHKISKWHTIIHSNYINNQCLLLLFDHLNVININSYLILKILIQELTQDTRDQLDCQQIQKADWCHM